MRPVFQRMHASVRICSVAFVWLLSLPFVLAQNQQSSLKVEVPKAEPPQTASISQLDAGSVSGGEYRNSQLGFRYQFPRGWIVDDKAAQKQALEIQVQFVWTDDSPTKVERKPAHQCSRDLLLVSQYPDEMRTAGFNSSAFLIAADPQCSPGVKFPENAKDNDAIKKVASRLGTYLKMPNITSQSPAHIRAFEYSGRVIMEVSQSFNVYTHEPGSQTVQNVRSSVLIMPANGYWVMCMFASDDDLHLDKLRATKFFFDTVASVPTGK
jgi:hypothetical protein